MIKSNKIINSWKEYEETILTDTMYYGSMIIFLNSIGLTIDKNLVKLISDGYLIPSFNKKWTEILLENVIYEHKEDYLEYEELIKKIKKELEILGCVEKRKIYLENVNNIKKIMASSIAKIDSIEEIAKKEYESLGNDLSMVVLADYVRSDFIDCDIEKINKLGVVPIFRRLQEKHICDNLAILTGKLKIVPKNVVPYIKEQLQLLELDNKAIFKDLKIDNNYVVITGGKKVNSAIVKIVTDCINLKKINIVIGTVALLGEGWDAPAINSLILASYVGSFMLSNQMRGRAIRKSKNINKTANIWHLASLAELGYNNFDFSDLELLQRRFKCFVGIAYYEDLIQDGIERLNIIDIGKLKKDYQSINEETYKIASDRKLMASRWKKILDLFGGKSIKIVNKLSSTRPVPNDYCYVYNFENPNQPIAISLEAGMGSEFKQDMNRFITKLLARLSKDLSGDMYEKEKKTILDRYHMSKEKLIKEFDKSTFEQGFKVRNTENGIYFSPVHNGVILNEKDFNLLDDKTKKYFEDKSPKIQEQTMQLLKELDSIDKKSEQVIAQWEENLTTFAVTQCMSDLKIKYKKNLKIQNFLYSVQSDVVKNVEFFKQYEQNLKKQKMQNDKLQSPNSYVKKSS